MDAAPTGAIWLPHDGENLYCQRHDANAERPFPKGEPCPDCLADFGSEAPDETVQRIEFEIAKVDRMLLRCETALRREARAATKLRQGVSGDSKFIAAAASASKAAISALKEAIAETRRRREDLEASLYRALERRAVEHGSR